MSMTPSGCEEEERTIATKCRQLPDCSGLAGIRWNHALLEMSETLIGWRRLRGKRF